MLKEIRLSTVGKIDIPTDIVIYDKFEFFKRVKNENSFENQIDREGVLLYEFDTKKLLI